MLLFSILLSYVASPKLAMMFVAIGLFEISALVAFIKLMQGQIVERGVHEKLLAAHSRFYENCSPNNFWGKIYVIVEIKG